MTPVWEVYQEREDGMDRLVAVCHSIDRAKALLRAYAKAWYVASYAYED